MKKVRVLVLGLGNFGHSWASLIVPDCEYAELVGVVDRRTERWEGIPDSVPKFTDLDEALRAVHPELVVNVTPPDAHHAINERLLREGWPVLCEKPIAESLETARKTGEVLKETGGFLMIGENYRYFGRFRRAREILESGCLGKVLRVSCQFVHWHPDYSMYYHGSLKHPLMQDVAVHHLDLGRYLSGAEPLRVWCREDSAPYTWYGERKATAFIVTEMTNGVVFDYNGTLASPSFVTDWRGEWTVICEKGVLINKGTTITIRRLEGTEEIEVQEDHEDSRVAMLADACCALREGRKGETDFSDNIRSFTWMERAMEAAAKESWLPVEA